MAKKAKVVEACSKGIKRHSKAIGNYFILRPKTDAMATKVVKAANTIADNSGQYYYSNGYPWSSDTVITIKLLQSADKKRGIDCTNLARACLSYALGKAVKKGFWPGVNRLDGKTSIYDRKDALDLKYIGSCLLNDVKPGDIITYPKNASQSATNGHVMVVVGSDTTTGGTSTTSENTGTTLVNRWKYPSDDSNKYFYSSKINPFCGSAGNGPPTAYHNCTWYAYGRYSEIAGLNSKSSIPTCNAQDWWTRYQGKNVGSKPKAGAVVVWASHHVAVVEKVFSNGDFITSNSAWNGGSPTPSSKPSKEKANHKCSSTKSDWEAYPYFYTEYVTKSSGYSSNCGKPQGFIYQPGDFHSLGDDGDGTYGSDTTTADMTERVAKLYASDNYHYLDNDVKKESLGYTLSNLARNFLINQLSNLIENAAEDSDSTAKETSTEKVVSDESFKKYLTAIGDTSAPRVAISKVEGTLSNTLDLIEAPFIELNLCGYIVGSYMNSLEDYPNHLSNISVKKVNGEINTYTIGLTHLVRTGEDPNVIDKLLSKARYDYVTVKYGDCMSGQVYYDDKVVISNVAMSRDYSSNKITYTIYATSACSYITSTKFSFVATTDKPSNVIRDALYQNVETSAILQEAFPEMASSAEVDSQGYIPNTDAVVDIPAQADMSAIDYINYLVALMGNATTGLLGTVAGGTITRTLQAVNGVVQAGVEIAKTIGSISTYFISYYTDHFEIKEVSKVSNDTTVQELASLTNTIYEVTVGYPDDNFVMDFSVDTTDGWSLLYNNGKVSSEYVYSINRDGITEKTYSPTISSNTDIMNQIEANWWKQMTHFPISATLTLRGLLKPLNLMDYIKIDVKFYGQSHHTSGIYVVTGQQDVLSSAGFRTQLSLLRISE